MAEKNEKAPEATKAPEGRPKLDPKTGAFLPSEYRTGKGNIRKDR